MLNFFKIKFYLIYLLNIYVLLNNNFKLIKCSTEEEKVIKSLFKGYNKLIRPVRNSSEYVVITMDLVLLQLINVVSLKIFNNHNKFHWNNNSIFVIK